MTPEEIVAKFAKLLKKFEPINGQPSDIDLTQIREAVVPLLLQILYNKTGDVHNLIGLIRPEAAYTMCYGAAFIELKKVEAYDATIDDDFTVVL